MHNISLTRICLVFGCARNLANVFAHLRFFFAVVATLRVCVVDSLWASECASTMWLHENNVMCVPACEYEYEYEYECVCV